MTFPEKYFIYRSNFYYFCWTTYFTNKIQIIEWGNPAGDEYNTTHAAFPWRQPSTDWRYGQILQKTDWEYYYQGSLIRFLSSLILNNSLTSYAVVAKPQSIIISLSKLQTTESMWNTLHCYSYFLFPKCSLELKHLQIEIKSNVQKEKKAGGNKLNQWTTCK